MAKVLQKDKTNLKKSNSKNNSVANKKENTSKLKAQKDVSQTKEKTLTINKTPTKKEQNAKPEKKPLLKVKGLNMHFHVRGAYKKVLDNICFDVNEGDFFGIIGESGSGKTTIGKVIIKLYQSTGGIIEFDNQLISQKKLDRTKNRWMRKNIQMIFQDPMSSMNPIKNIYKIVSEPLIINKIASNETKEYIFKIHSVNKYFKQIFIEKNKKLLYYFEKEYYSTLIDDYQKAINSCLKYNENNVNSLLDASEIVDAILNDLIDTLQDNLEKSYKLLDDQKNLILETFKLFDDELKDHEFNSSWDYTSSNLSKYFKKSKELENFEEKEKELNEYDEKIHKNFVNEYKLESDGYKKVIFAKITSDIKLHKQSKELSKNEITFMYYHFLELISKQTKFVLENSFNNLKYLSIKEIEEIIEYVETFFRNKYDKILTNLLVKEKNFLVDDLKQRISILESLSEEELIYSELKLNYKNLLYPTNEKILREIAEKYLEISNSKLNNLYSKSNETKLKISNLFNELLSLKTNIQFDESKKLDHTKIVTEIYQLKIQAKEIQKEFKRVVVDFLDRLSNKEVEKAEGFISKYNIKKDIKAIRESLNPKWRTQNAISYEFNNSMKRFNVNSMLYTSNKFTSLFLYPLIKNNIILEKVYEALRSVGLKHEHAYRYPHEFSGGQRQRIVIARALITKPKLIIADEPISALDVSIQSQVVNIMRKLAKEQNVTFLFIAHDLSMVSYACNRLIIMHSGRIVEKGDVKSIFENPIHPYTKSLFKAVPELSRIHVDLASFNENMDYDKEYNLLNQPSFENVNKNLDHHVFGTSDQIKKWTSEKN